MRAAVLAVLIALPACSDPAPTAVQAVSGRYVVGEPYALGGRWYYPREDPSLVETGLAVIATDARPGRRTANGEVHDPAQPSAAHRTLPMPTVLRVTNLENGRDILLRLNDRGPAHPGRVVELSQRAAELLAVAPGRPAQVRMAVDAAASRALAATLPSDTPVGPRVETIPVAVIARESLSPPPGARGAVGRDRTAERDVPVAAAPVTVSLPSQATQGAPAPGQLFVAGSTFTGRDAAARQAVRMGAGARSQPASAGRSPDWRVRAGPFATIEEADTALDAALRSGVSEARILVE